MTHDRHPAASGKLPEPVVDHPLTGRASRRLAERRAAGARLALFLMTAAYLHGAALADSRQTRFTVSVTVPLRTDLVILEEPNPLMLSATDVTRGYKVVSARYRVMCTSQSGYLLQLIPRVGLAHSIDIAGLAQTVTVRDETVEVWRRPDAGADEFVLRLRLDLESAARPGHYLMPLFVTAVPL